LTGPGLAFRLEDAEATVGDAAADGLVTARDVRILVQELWLAGAEAVSINGERAVVTTAILDIGNSILVNSAYLAPPYEVRAIGPADLYTRLTSAASFVEFVRSWSSCSGGSTRRACASPLRNSTRSPFRPSRGLSADGTCGRTSRRRGTERCVTRGIG